MTTVSQFPKGVKRGERERGEEEDIERGLMSREMRS